MPKNNIMITGVSTGIGYAAAKTFLQRGCRVFGSVRSERDATRVKQALGEQFTPLIFDVTDSDAVQAGARFVAEEIENEGLACLINNAGIAISGVLQHLSLDNYRKQFEANVFGVVSVTQSFLPLLGAKSPCPHPPGRILNISSVAGQLAMPFMSPYCGSKHALEGISNCLRRELMIYGIDVIVVAPGTIKTPIWTKAQEKEIPEALLQSDWGPYLRRLKDAFEEEAKAGLEVNDFADKLYGIFTAKHPKTRYAFSPNKFVKWTIPRYLLSSRTLDKFWRKMMKI